MGRGADVVVLTTTRYLRSRLRRRTTVRLTVDDPATSLGRTVPVLTPGQTAPDFTLPAADGSSVTLSDLRGQKVIVYFYSQAGTLGCTRQACDFRDSMASFEGAGYRVLGISPDSVKELAAFTETENLGFTLLADPEHVVMEPWGAWGLKKLYGREVTGTIRGTVVIDENGVVTHALTNVKATGHVARLRKLLGLDA